jgi:hypothetical protein
VAGIVSVVSATVAIRRIVVVVIHTNQRIAAVSSKKDELNKLKLWDSHNLLFWLAI